MVFNMYKNGVGVLLLAVCFLTGAVLPASASPFITAEMQVKLKKNDEMYHLLQNAYAQKRWSEVVALFEQYKKVAVQPETKTAKYLKITVDTEEHASRKRQLAKYNALCKKLKAEYITATGLTVIALVHDKQITEAETLLSGVQKHADEHAIISVAQGIVAYTKKEYPKAKTLLKAAFTRDKTLFESVYYLYKVAMKQSEPGTAYFWLEKAVVLAPERLDLLMGQAKLLQKLGQSAAAEAMYSKLLEVDPTNAVAFNNRGYCRVAIGDVDGAFSDFSKAISINSMYTEALLNRAALWRTTTNLSAALEDLNAGLRVSPGDTRLLVSRMQALSDMGNYMLAKQDMEELLTRSDSITVINEAAWFLATCPSELVRDGKRALRLLTSVVERSKRHPRVLDSLAAAYAATDEFDKAVTIQKEALTRGAAYRLSQRQLGKYEKRLALYSEKRPFITNVD